MVDHRVGFEEEEEDVKSSIGHNNHSSACTRGSRTEQPNIA
jgi:hypothetical protein